jgi:hypothetical protein
VFEGSFDPNRSASTILMHRPLPVGARLRTLGTYRNHRRAVTTRNGTVIFVDADNLQLDYDVTKAVMDVDLHGDTKRIRYTVNAVTTSDADLLPRDAVGEQRSARLHGAVPPHVESSAGQVFDLQLQDDKIAWSVLGGELNRREFKALSDPFGPAYELGMEKVLASMFGPRQPQREGDEWDIDLELAAQVLQAAASSLEAPLKVTGRASFVARDEIAGIPVQRIEAWARAEGTLRVQLDGKKLRFNRSVFELTYKGAFPVDLSLPPMDHDWTFKGDSHLVGEPSEQLGELHIDVLTQHHCRIAELRR